MRRSLYLLLLALGFGLGPAEAAVYHVAAEAQHASDKNPGSLTRPWKTLGHAALVTRAGDTVYVHAGRYPETVQMQAEGTRRAPITFAVFGNDQVTLDGADLFPADRWQPVKGSRCIFATPLAADPGQVFVDGRPIYMKVEKLAPDKWRLDALTDQDVNLWQYDKAARRLLLNLGGRNPAANHRIEIPVRRLGLVLKANCRVRGFNLTRYWGGAISAPGDDDVVEDCRITDCNIGIGVSGWNRRGVIIRRNTVIGCLGNGIDLHDRPTGCRVEENLVVRCSLNPWHAVLWAGSIKMNSAADTIFAHNVVLEAGNPQTIGGWDGWGLWGDINIVRVMYVGNCCAHNKEAGLYVEYAMGDTRAYYNTSYRDGHGITCRASQRGVFMHNYVQSARGSGLAVWAAVPPYPTVDNVFAHNLVRDCAPSLRLQTEQPEFADYNVYWPRQGAPLADGEKGRHFQTIDDLRRATGHELHGQVKNLQPADLGLGTVTFRVPDARDPTEVLSMIGNSGCELADPAGVNLLPYFWHAGTGDGVPHTFVYAAYTGVPGGIDAFAYGGAGGSVSLRYNPKLAHGGNRCLEVNGYEPKRIPAQGLGFWSPTLPARPGDTIEMSFWVRGRNLQPVGKTPLVAFACFTSQTGQFAQDLSLVKQQPGMSGTFAWRQIEAEVRVPETARRVAMFFGLGPAKGTVWYDDLSWQVK